MKWKKRLAVLLAINLIFTCNLFFAYGEELVSSDNAVSEEVILNESEATTGEENTEGNKVPIGTEDEQSTESEKEVNETFYEESKYIDLSETFAESKAITKLGKIDLSVDNTSDNSDSLLRSSPPFYPDSYGVPIAGFNQTPSWIKRVPNDKQNDIMKPANTIPIGAGTATRLNSNMTLTNDGSVTFSRIPDKVTNYGNIVQYTNDNAGYIAGRAIKSNTVIKMISDSTSSSYLGERSCMAVYPGLDLNTNLEGICFISMHPDQFSGDNPSIRSKPLNSFVVDVEIRYKDTNEIVDKPLEILVSDLDVLQNAFYVPESMHFDNSLVDFSTYDRTQLRYNSTSTMSEFTKGFVGSPNNTAVYGDDSIFVRGGHAKTRNGKFRVGFTECNCTTFLNVGAAEYTVKPPTGKLKLKKTVANDEHLTSLCPEQYTLAGAEYTVYSDSACSNKVGVLKTTAQKKGTDGKLYAESNELELEFKANEKEKTFYVKETKASKGYRLDKTPYYEVKVKSGETKVLPVKEKPDFDPLTLRLQKQIPDGHPEFQKYLEGAEYTVRYYPEFYTTEAEVKGKTPLRTWVFRTDSDGMILIADRWKVGGDQLFKNDKGVVLGLFGTYTFEETKAPSGFHKNTGLEIRQIKQGVTPPDINATNAPIFSELPDENMNHSITLTKKIKESDVYKAYGYPTAIFELKGMDIYGNEYTFRKSVTLDKSTLKNGYYSGSVTFDNLEAGEYTAREIKTSRYVLKGISSVSENGKVKSDNTIDFELVNTEKGKATYENKISTWKNTSHNAVCVNHF